MLLLRAVALKRSEAQRRSLLVTRSAEQVRGLNSTRTELVELGHLRRVPRRQIARVQTAERERLV
jgi:ribosomal protein L29